MSERRWIWHGGVPRAKERPRLGRVNRDGTVAVYTPARTRDEEQLIGWEWASKYPGQEPLTGDVAVTLVAVGGRGDTDNTAKLCLDSLNGVAYCDDRQVVSLVAYKLPAGCGLPTGTYIAVRPLARRWRRGVVGWLAQMLKGAS